MNTNRKTKRKQQKFYAAVLSTALLCSSVPFTAFAEGDIPKEEIVYVNLKSDGTVKEINVVNSFELKKDGEIVDYGKYQSLRNMTTTDAIAYEGDCVKVNTTAGKLYYEGKLVDNVMPWDIGIRYELDGKEISADELAGKSGSLRVVLYVSKNEQCPGSFFDDFALQASMTLDTEKCSNIRADSATLANVGSNKQVTWTVLPGTEEELVLTADVQDFEMDGIAVNGVTLNLNVEVDDEELMDQVEKLLDAIEQLDDGAGELDDGAGELDGGVEELQSSVQGELQSGAGALDTGV